MTTARTAEAAVLLIGGPTGQPELAAVDPAGTPQRVAIGHHGRCHHYEFTGTYRRVIDMPLPLPVFRWIFATSASKATGRAVLDLPQFS